MILLTASPTDEGLKDTLGPWYGIFQKRAQQHDVEEDLITKRGSQGEVRLEIDDQDRKIAVKTIYYGDRKDVDKVIQDFKRESQSLESLRHPSIIRILGHADDPEKRQAVLRMDWASCNLSETGSADLRDIIALRDHRCEEDQTPSNLPESFLWHVFFHLGSALALCHHGIAIRTTRILEQVDSKSSLKQLDPDPPEELLTIAEHTPQVFWTTQQVSFFKKPNHEPVVHRDIKPSNGNLSSHFAAGITSVD
ncbi:hypothetical protein KAF25_003527 [Fusarium avenaceum]|uniref:Protein kinase domain-containing protein n=1 Tax=Fusarium avenaceum TaxID=40199 RepID=A0A9P7H2R4_9HYPO|nr:hypothetical protein KAF25_003527 [Fusarium avenaceum]